MDRFGIFFFFFSLFKVTMDFGNGLLVLRTENNCNAENIFHSCLLRIFKEVPNDKWWYILLKYYRQQEHLPQLPVNSPRSPFPLCAPFIYLLGRRADNLVFTKLAFLALFLFSTNKYYALLLTHCKASIHGTKSCGALQHHHVGRKDWGCPKKCASLRWYGHGRVIWDV